MARKMALNPQYLVSEYYELNKPEIRVEDNISKLLNEEETPDDVKAKLLSHWIPKYQRLMQPPPPQEPFEIPKELLQETEAEQEISSPAPSKLNMIVQNILLTQFQKLGRSIFYLFWRTLERLIICLTI
ncbi:uncharacterized protein TNCT_592821 [Trichonephila clavata]|uniref:Uncharacterized protein n=1 Tax=Trichonephila clavata TaxID=2740835 RepID=A0A8X6I1W1_TRICU|nr:uncharacterized protein TNCT_592821 [Trichonephila clavata]